MSLNVNGYNDTFQSFVDFARIRDGMGDKTAIARVTEGVNVAEGALAGRTITASDTDSIRGMFKWFRSADDKAANAPLHDDRDFRARKTRRHHEGCA